MRVTIRANTPRRLDLRLRPVSVWAYWTFGAAFIIAGAWSGATLGRAMDLHCERSNAADGKCSLALSNGLGWTRRAIPAQDILGVQSEIRRNIFSATSVVVLRLRGGAIDLPLVAADGIAKDSIAAQINRFVADTSRAAFDVREDMRLIGWMLGLLVAAGGVICILAIERVRLVLDRDRGKVKITRAKMLGISRDEFDLARLVRVEKNEFTFKQARSWAVLLILDDDAEVPLARSPLFTHASADLVTTLITGFLA